MSIVEDWNKSLSYNEYVLKQLNDRIALLNILLNDILVDPRDQQQLKKYEEFYHSFQEACDLYHFWYLGHFVRSEHYYKQPTVDVKHNKMFLSYSIYQYKKTSLEKIYVAGTKYWLHCICYLTHAL
jgi:hypothetical protein